MWKIRKFSLQLGLELIITRIIDEVLTNWTTEAFYEKILFSPAQNLEFHTAVSTLKIHRKLG